MFWQTGGKDMTRVGVIGVGGMGFTHVKALKSLAEEMDLQVVAIADLQEKYQKRAKEEWPKATIYAEGAELLEKEQLDAVHICVPSYKHAELAIQAMNKGIDVLVEKPACLKEEDCERMLAAKEANHVSVMVGQVVRFFPEYRYLREAYKNQTFGKLKSLSMQRLSGNVTWGYEDWFHDEEKSGSVVLDLHIHDLDFLRYTFGDPKEMSCTATAYASGMVNQIITNYTFDGVDAPVSAEGLWAESSALPFCPRFYAQFEQADVVFDGREKPDTLKVYHADGTVEKPDVKEAFSLEGGMQGLNISTFGPYYTEIQYFYQCRKEGKNPDIASLEEGLASVKYALKEWGLAKKYVEEKKS